MHDESNGSFAFVVDSDNAGKRLDAFITSSFTEISRNSAVRLIRQGFIYVQDIHRKPSFRLNIGDVVAGVIKSEKPIDFCPEPIPLDIIFEDTTLLVLNKPPGLVVHPSPGHAQGTLANGLIYHYPQIIKVGDTTRPGLVHRLDKDTSGLMVVAKTTSAYHQLKTMFKDRTIGKKYLGFTYGVPDGEEGRVLLSIARDLKNRKKMTTTNDPGARNAETNWKLKQNYNQMSLLEFDIKTGRTHQIRVHCAAIRHPIVGDPVYGLKRPHKFLKNNPDLIKIVSTVQRQMLHAWKLRLIHPKSGKLLLFEAELPEDMLNFQNAISQSVN